MGRRWQGPAVATLSIFAAACLFRERQTLTITALSSTDRQPDILLVVLDDVGHNDVAWERQLDWNLRLTFLTITISSENILVTQSSDRLPRLVQLLLFDSLYIQALRRLLHRFVHCYFHLRSMQ